MIKKILFISLIFLNLLNYAQVINWEPKYPSVNDTITITYDATQGNSALEGVTPVYAHTGVLSLESVNESDWQHKIARWGEGDSLLIMDDIGNNKHQIRFHIKDFYDIHQSETISELCFVFRDVDGNLAGKNTDGSDITIPIWTSDMQARFILPVKFPLVPNTGETIPITVKTKNTGMINLFHDGNLVSQAYDTILNFTLIPATIGKHLIWFEAQIGSQTIVDTLYYLVQEPVNIAALPTGIIDGINYTSETSVTLCLLAPYKQRVYLIGDWNNWELHPDYQLNRTPDGKRWWITLNDLTPNQEYRFQYLVDFDINIADPYSDKLLDRWNDPGIHQFIYPDLISYPVGKTSRMVSVLETGQDPYEWQTNDFEQPDNRDMVIYELLVRDWHLWHNYQTIMDSIRYIKDLGMNTIELMPVNEYDGNDSWGYMPAFYFAPDKCYGTKNTLKAFIDTCHANGIAVIIDMVLNHASGENTMARLYYNKEMQRPSAENIWFNELIPHPYGYHNDFDHGSTYTQAFVDSVLSYWVSEYHVDGFRLDLSKGFTNDVTVTYDEDGEIIGTDVGAWGNYNPTRIGYIQRMLNVLWEHHPNTIMILEHLASFNEEKALSDLGCMLWCGVSANSLYSQAAMGYSDNSDFKYGVSYQHYQGSSLGRHNLIGYMESHDEERLMYKCYTWGNQYFEDADTIPEYDIKNKQTALERMGQVAAFFFTVPGPKMFWQFGERGYDYSINWPAVDDPGATRTGKKPPKWDYMEDTSRQYLFNVYRALIDLKQSHSIFRTSNYEMSTAAYDKRIRLWDDGYVNAEMQVVVLGNFNIVEQNVWPEFSHTGYWYDYFTGDSILIAENQIEENGFTFDYAAGEYHIYTDMRLDKPDMSVHAEQDAIPGVIGNLFNVTAFPNPFKNSLNINFSLSEKSDINIHIYNLLGETLYTQNLSNMVPGRYEFPITLNNLSKGYYVYSITSNKGKISGKIIQE
jgi:hypothetical protein